MLQDQSFIYFISGFTHNKNKQVSTSIASPPASAVPVTNSRGSIAPESSASVVAEATEAAAQTPLPPTFSKDTRLQLDEIIPLDEKAFCHYRRDGSIQGTGDLTRGSAAKKAEFQAIFLEIVNLVNTPKLRDRQKVQALRKASAHHLSRRIFHSVGLIDIKRYEAMKH